MPSDPITLAPNEVAAQDPPGQRRHKLKCDDAVFDALWDGSKCFEFRLNDRDYRVGDVLELRECRKGQLGTPMETGRVCVKQVSYILHGGCYGVPAGYCVMALRERTPKVLDTSLLNRADDGSAGGRELVRELARREKLDGIPPGAIIGPRGNDYGRKAARRPSEDVIREGRDEPLTPARAREVMGEYPEWSQLGCYWHHDDGRAVGIIGQPDRRAGVSTKAAAMDAYITITTEAQLRSFAEGRGA